MIRRRWRDGEKAASNQRKKHWVNRGKVAGKYREEGLQFGCGKAWRLPHLDEVQVNGGKVTGGIEEG